MRRVMRDLLKRARMAVPVAFGAVACLMGCTGGPADPSAATVPVVEGLPDTVTFAHVAPIIRSHCTGCHRPGQVGPFPLTSYNDVRRKAKTVRKMVVGRWMPPWPADTAYSRFLGERTLNARQIATIAKWVDQGALAGDTSALPPLPAFPIGPATGVLPAMGPPDAVVWLPDTFHIRGDNRDRFIITKAPFELERDTFLRAVEFVPGNRRYAHHMNGAMVSYAEGAKRDVAAGAAYINADSTRSLDAFAELLLQNDDGTWPVLTPNLVNYLPGLSPPIYPPGIGGYRLPRKGAFLLNTMHYGPSMRDTTDRSRFNLWYGAVPPQRPMKELFLGTLGSSPVVPELVVPPDTVMTFRTSLRVPADISVLSINPHLHLLGKSFLAYAVSPAKDTIPLIRIPDWDFRWQYAYTFPYMLHLPRNAVIHVEVVMDNTSANPNNPYDPPRTALAPKGRHMRTTDEMLQFFVNYVDYRPGDEQISLDTRSAGPVAGAPR
ncbi:MAG: hypothetical protein KBF80_13350 [Flavobacteriales bacterium]|nr:hypothetical protein [Flavobacteriales bacterium]